ncbi:SRPBCC family protein [Chitinasiproducens palmae]|uniref:DUF1857 family protein n=1 Tax=Chitinasiproducens palmae TaxID=1770053 RepID=A0A1H2PSA8_9BURK|nr:SRPBCC family protein [Chitinasiproducens palmae]SDV49032.1 protein of unknown function [Chitinasiproducens palmae]
MNYEHLVQINDPLNPLVATLTRADLWRGLVLRAEQPQIFVPGLDDCRITARGPNSLERELHYGQAIVKDRVIFTPEESVRYEIDPTSEYVGGHLTMTIETPDEIQLFVRFRYETTLVEGSGGEDEQTSEIVKSAYREADIDTITMIRQLIESGRFERPLH